MATIRAYTTIEQSRKLAEILPIESADMSWVSNGLGKPFARTIPIKGDPEELCGCWSLTALLSVLPKGTNISTPNPINALSYCCWNQYDEIYADNPIDACYELILKLHELKMM